MTHRITAASIANFKKVRDVAITPSADRSVVLIAGKNAQGKSSVLDALTAAFGGKRAVPVDPVRHGADKAEIVIELDGGDMVVRRSITADGGGTLEVRSKDGPIRSPQALLDKIIGGDRFLDPISFLHQPASEQRALLLKIADPDGKIHSLEARRQQEYDARTETGRDLKRAKAELESTMTLRMVAVSGSDEPIDVASLADERARLSEKQQEGAKLVARKEIAVQADREASALLEANTDEARKLQRQLDELRSKADGLRANVVACDKQATEAEAAVQASLVEWKELQPRRDEIDAQLARATEHNRKVYELQALKDRQDAAKLAVEKLTAQSDEQTAKIDKLERRKLEVISGSKLPVDNLGVEKDGITLNGVPFAQASGAERLRVALALAIAASPGLADIWIRDGALLDDESLSIVEQHAEATGHRVWIERVGTGDDGAIVIQDGMVVP